MRYGFVNPGKARTLTLGEGSGRDRLSMKRTFCFGTPTLILQSIDDLSIFMHF